MDSLEIIKDRSNLANFYATQRSKKFRKLIGICLRYNIENSICEIRRGVLHRALVLKYMFIAYACASACEKDGPLCEVARANGDGCMQVHGVYL